MSASGLSRAQRDRLEATGVDPDEQDHETHVDMATLFARQSQAQTLDSSWSKGDVENQKHEFERNDRQYLNAQTPASDVSLTGSGNQDSRSLHRACRQICYAALLWPAIRSAWENNVACSMLAIFFTEISGILCIARAIQIAWNQPQVSFDQVVTMALAVSYLFVTYGAGTGQGLMNLWTIAVSLYMMKISLRSGRSPRLIVMLLLIGFMMMPPSPHSLMCPDNE